MAESRTSVQNYEKVPPHSREAEMSVLGAMLFDENALTLAIEVLKPEYFYETPHVQAFSVLQTLFDRKQPADLLTVSEELRKRGQLESVGGATYLTQLTAAVPTAANIQHYSKIVKDLHIRFVVKQDKFSFSGIGFNLSEKMAMLKNPVDIVFTLDENEWNGNISLQLKIIDLRISE